MYNNLKNCLGVRLFSSTLNVILRRERSELSGESRNFMAIFLNAANSIVSHFLNVINGLVPLILVQRDSYLINKVAILLHKYRFRQDCRDKPGNDGCWGRWLNTYCKFFK